VKIKIKNINFQARHMFSHINKKLSPGRFDLYG